MKKKVVFVWIICILLFTVGITFAQEVEVHGGWGAKDVVDGLIELYGAIPDNEYYLLITYESGETESETLPSCAEALNRKDALLRRDNVVSVTIRSLYRTHIHSDCNTTYYK